MEPNHFDLGVAWDWEYDRDFIGVLEQQLHSQGLLFYSISHHNTQETLKLLQKGTLSFGAFLDRASEADEKFLPLVRFIKKSPVFFLNHPDAVQHAIDKATMHLEFITKGIHVPFTIIISPYNKKREVELSIGELARLGRPFIIKPANTTGGGIGVILGAETLKDVIESRQHHKNDKYLLQEKIVPARFDTHKAWFRVFHVCGTVIPCWWDDETHLYETITQDDVARWELRPLIAETRKIADVCKLEFFSTEIATTPNRKFIVVDYVNEICDMRMKSGHIDGVPDIVVTEVCKRIALLLRSRRKDSRSLT
jgi:glutathione synthase/RimK-type ligase-like ATP-grasp enzyme